MVSKIGLALIYLGAPLATANTTSATDEMVKIVDIAGRSVEVKNGAERVILGEGRLI